MVKIYKPHGITPESECGINTSWERELFCIATESVIPHILFCWMTVLFILYYLILLPMNGLWRHCFSFINFLLHHKLQSNCYGHFLGRRTFQRYYLTTLCRKIKITNIHINWKFRDWNYH